MTSPFIPAAVRAFDDNAVQVDGGSQSAIDHGFARNTSALAARAGGNFVCATWPGHTWIATSPKAVVSALATWTEVKFDYSPAAIADGQCLLPFHMTPGFTDILAMVRLAARTRHEVTARLVLRQIAAETMTTVYSSPSPTLFFREPLGWGLWSIETTASTRLWAAQCNLRVVAPAVSTTRRFLVGVQVMVSDVSSTAIDLGDDIDIHLETLMIADSLPAES